MIADLSRWPRNKNAKLILLDSPVLLLILSGIIFQKCLEPKNVARNSSFAHFAFHASSFFPYRNRVLRELECPSYAYIASLGVFLTKETKFHTSATLCCKANSSQ